MQSDSRLCVFAPCEELFLRLQVIVQRVLAAKDYSNAKGGCVFAGWLKFLPLWLLVFPGMVARVLYPNEVGCTDPEVCKNECGSERGCSNIAYPKMVTSTTEQWLAMEHYCANH